MSAAHAADGVGRPWSSQGTVVGSATGALAIQIDTGGGVITPNDPMEVNGANNDGGANPAHGAYCGSISSVPEERGATCARHGDHPENPGATPPGVEGRTFQSVDGNYYNLGAWNAFFLSNPNSAICGINDVIEPCP